MMSDGNITETESNPVVPDWQQRVISEKSELEERLNKLADFLHKTRNDSEREPLLLMQYHAMSTYLEILKERIRCF